MTKLVHFPPFLLEHEDALHCIASGWFIAGKDKGEFRELKCHLPRPFMYLPANVGKSNHYGVVLMESRGGKVERAVYQAKFSRPIADLIQPN